MIGNGGSFTRLKEEWVGLDLVKLNRVDQDVFKSTYILVAAISTGLSETWNVGGRGR
jgi:hypothetical protein